jgi:hypothetical protein
MRPLQYHSGQRAIQTEANATVVADRLAEWVGPVVEFALGADLILLAAQHDDQTLRFTVLSGASPLVDAIDEPTISIRFPAGLKKIIPAGTRCGGLVINLSKARRSRINGVVSHRSNAAELIGEETFTLCKKYMAPSVSLEKAPHIGPESRKAIKLDDPWVTAVVRKAETSFLASISPDGGPDVAHRGGPPEFLNLDPAARRLTWTEYLGDGIFKSAGNIRATGIFTLLVPDLELGDGVELVGRGTYTNIRTTRKQRVDPLLQDKEQFPVQGTMTCIIQSAFHLKHVFHPRQRIEKAHKVTSRSTVDEQAPD